MRRPTTTSSSMSSLFMSSSNDYFNYNIKNRKIIYHFIYLVLFFFLLVPSEARTTVTEGGQPLTELLSSLDQPYPCGHVVEAEHFLSTAVALKFPRLIQLAHFFANHSKNFDPQLLDKSSFLPHPPFEVSFARRTHFYGLELNCTGNNHR
ncbi:hypothetical protein CAEBREN_32005 [Caenorhabditis brenneri]|uniref:Uncharacterized protein n=1 Tax=Caenorhabditis brenneri TaxID=135651 RepID=G0NFR1_CAEBE|nr:hypothetical protein CAEBREN_32005 [Caenorhabditis brenneri]